jgi:cell division protein FtsB
MKLMITTAILVLAFSSAHAAPGKSAASRVDALAKRAKATEPQTKEGKKTAAGQAEVKKAVKDLDSRAAIEELAKTEKGLREQAAAFFNDAKVPKANKEAAAELSRELAKADRSGEDSALDAATGATEESRGALIGLLRASFAQVKNDSARAEVAREAMVAASAKLKARPGNFVEAADAAVASINAKKKPGAERVTRKKLKEDCNKA